MTNLFVSAQLPTEAVAKTLMGRFRPGDIICFLANSAKPDTISEFQSRFAPPYTIEAASVIHVALYVGDNEIIHALKSGGVQRANFWAYCSTYGTAEISVVRMLGISAAEEQAVCDQAVARLGQPYNTAQVRRLATQHLARRRANAIASAADLEALICSELVKDCYAAAVKDQSPFDMPAWVVPVFLPADVYMGTGLLDVLA